MEQSTVAFAIGIGVQLLAAGAAWGLHKQTQKFQGERINAHDLSIAKLTTEKADQATTVQRLAELDRDKVDVLFHTATVTRLDESIRATGSRLDETIRGVSHRGANTEQRVYALESNRNGRLP